MSEKLYKDIKKNNGIIFNLDEEGGIDYADGSTLLARYSKELFNYSDLIFLWGEEQYNLIKKNFSNSKKVFVTGHPRFELLRPNFKYLYSDEVKKIKKSFNNYILVNTNMSFGNNIKGDTFVRENYGSRFKNINEIIEFDKKLLKVYGKLIIEISEKLNQNIILRPHPEEDHSFYLNFFKKNKNIHIIYEGSVIPWVIAADVMIHPDCTTAVESLFTGKKPISFLPPNYPKDLITHLPLKASKCFNSSSKLISYIINNKESISKVDLSNYAFAEKYFSSSLCSTKLIINQFSKFFKSNIENKISLKIKTKFYLKSIKNLTNKNEIDKLIKTKLEGLSSRYLFSLSTLLKKSHPELNRVSIKKINEHLYKINTK